MQTITGLDMALAVSTSGGLSILHRFMPFTEQLSIVDELVNKWGVQNRFAVSIGVKPEDKENVLRFIDAGVKIFCIDIAHGDSIHTENMALFLRRQSSSPFVIAGNVATASGARRLWDAGAHAVKVGIGPGSLCTTRLETGNGVPQLTALMNVAEVYQQGEYIIADGGIKNAGDIVKALCFADMVMVGNIFAGCEETPGRIMYVDGKPVKEYVGSSTHRTNHVEGVAALVPIKGRYDHILSKLLEGVRSGCSYQGAHKISHLRENPEFIKITNAGLRESHPHDITLK